MNNHLQNKQLIDNNKSRESYQSNLSLNQSKETDYDDQISCVENIP